MESEIAVAALSALAHAGRLDVFRRLVQAGPGGMAAGDIARASGSRPNTLSANLAILAAAGLVGSRREGRSIVYSARFDRMTELLAFLMEDCCAGRPEVCAPLVEAASRCCAAPGPNLLTELTMAAPYNILFLCTGNSARSILAEAIMNRVGAGKFVAYSAGSMPKGAVHPQAVKLLDSLGYDTAGLRSKPWDEFAAPGAPPLDFVVTVCDNAAGEVCPIWPGQPVRSHWGVPDPAAVEGTETEVALAFAEAYRLLSNRIRLFAALPVEKLDRLSLARRMDEIGASADQPATA